MGLLTMPWGLVVLVAFALEMFAWGYRSAVRLGSISAPEPESDGVPLSPPSPSTAARQG